MTSDRWSRRPSLQQLNKQPPDEGTWVLSSLTEGSGSDSGSDSASASENTRRGSWGTYLQSARLRLVTVMENSVEQSTLSIVGVLPRWAVCMRTLVYVRVWGTEQVHSPACLSASEAPFEIRVLGSVTYVFVYYTQEISVCLNVCVCVCYICMSKVFFYLSLLKVLPMDFMAALENNLKRQRRPGGALGFRTQEEQILP